MIFCFFLLSLLYTTIYKQNKDFGIVSFKLNNGNSNNNSNTHKKTNTDKTDKKTVTNTNTKFNTNTAKTETGKKTNIKTINTKFRSKSTNTNTNAKSTKNTNTKTFKNHITKSDSKNSDPNVYNNISTRHSSSYTQNINDPMSYNDPNHSPHNLSSKFSRASFQHPSNWSNDSDEGEVIVPKSPHNSHRHNYNSYSGQLKHRNEGSNKGGSNMPHEHNRTYFPNQSRNPPNNHDPDRKPESEFSQWNIPRGGGIENLLNNDVGNNGNSAINLNMSGNYASNVNADMAHMNYNMNMGNSNGNDVSGMSPSNMNNNMNNMDMGMNNHLQNEGDYDLDNSNRNSISNLNNMKSTNKEPYPYTNLNPNNYHNPDSNPNPHNNRNPGYNPNRYNPINNSYPQQSYKYNDYTDKSNNFKPDKNSPELKLDNEKFVSNSVPLQVFDKKVQDLDLMLINRGLHNSQQITNNLYNNLMLGRNRCFCANKNALCDCDEVMDTDLSELPPIIMPIIRPVYLPPEKKEEKKQRGPPVLGKAPKLPPKMQAKWPGLSSSPAQAAAKAAAGPTTCKCRCNFANEGDKNCDHKNLEEKLCDCPCPGNMVYHFGKSSMNTENNQESIFNSKRQVKLISQIKNKQDYYSKILSANNGMNLNSQDNLKSSNVTKPIKSIKKPTKKKGRKKRKNFISKNEKEHNQSQSNTDIDIETSEISHNHHNHHENSTFNKDDEHESGLHDLNDSNDAEVEDISGQIQEDNQDGGGVDNIGNTANPQDNEPTEQHAQIVDHYHHKTNSSFTDDDDHGLETKDTTWDNHNGDKDNSDGVDEEEDRDNIDNAHGRVYHDHDYNDVSSNSIDNVEVIDAQRNYNENSDEFPEVKNKTTKYEDEKEDEMREKEYEKKEKEVGKEEKEEVKEKESKEEREEEKEVEKEEKEDEMREKERVKVKEKEDNTSKSIKQYKFHKEEPDLNKTDSEKAQDKEVDISEDKDKERTTSKGEEKASEEEKEEEKEVEKEEKEDEKLKMSKKRLKKRHFLSKRTKTRSTNTSESSAKPKVLKKKSVTTENKDELKREVSTKIQEPITKKRIEGFPVVGVETTVFQTQKIRRKKGFNNTKTANANVKKENFRFKSVESLSLAKAAKSAKENDIHLTTYLPGIVLDKLIPKMDHKDAKGNMEDTVHAEGMVTAGDILNVGIDNTKREQKKDKIMEKMRKDGLIQS